MRSKYIVLLTFLNLAVANECPEATEDTATTDCYSSCERYGDESTCVMNINKISTENDVFSAAGNLYVVAINLHGNDVKFLPPSNEHFSSLFEFSAIDTTFESANRENFKHYAELDTLTLNRGRLMSICSDTFSDLQTLTSLDLSQNMIKFLHPNLFDNLNSLKKLKIEANYIEVLHSSAFKNLKKLSFLDFSGNRIIYVESALFVNNVKLSFIDVGKNNLIYTQSDTFDNLKNLNRIVIGDNPCMSSFEHLQNGLVSEENFKDLKYFIAQHCNNRNNKEIDDSIERFNEWFAGSDKCEKTENSYFEKISFKGGV